MTPNRRRASPDYVLLFLALFLLAWGLLTLASAGAVLAERLYGDPFFFLKRQAATAAAGLGLLAWLAGADYHRLREWAWPSLLACCVLLAAVLFADPVAGVRRWLRLGPLGVQPAEPAKLAVVLFLADYADRKHSRVASWLHGTIVPWAVVGLVLGLIALEPDLGTPAVIFLVGALMLFLGGSRIHQLAGTLACAAPVLVFELLRYPYRRRRMLNFLDPFADAQGAGYQLSQSLLAVGSGGWLGAGLGGSKLKLLYLPAPHTDFIFPVLCEETGLAGSLALLGLFAALALRGLRAARNAPDLFGTLLAAGLTLLICLQAVFNTAMSVGLLPTKGLPLPFFSYGRSSLLVTLAAVGVLLSISRAGEVRPSARPRA